MKIIMIKHLCRAKLCNNKSLTMTLLKFNERTHIFLTGAIAFLLPAYPPILAPVIVLLTINWLSAPKLMMPGLKNILHNPALLLMILLYFLYLAGMLYSDNIKFGYETIETKLSFLIFPLVLSPYVQICKDNLNKYLKLFIYGAIVNAVVCFVWATYSYFKPVYFILDGIAYDIGTNNFYYNQLSLFMHPSYIAMYSVFALMSLVHLVNAGELKLNWKWIAAIFLLIVFILLLSSKAGWISLFLFVLYFCRRLVIKKRTIFALLMVGFLIGLFSLLNIYFTPRFSSRIPQLSVISETLRESNDKNKKTETSIDGSRSRILVWKAAVEIIKNNFWIGVGTGDAKDKMLEKYIEKEMTYEYKYKLNSHNQYLNTFIAIGVVGFTTLVLCFMVPFYFAYKEKTFLFVAFIIIVGLNFLFESMLETQAGVIFYAFFNSLLCFNKS